MTTQAERRTAAVPAFATADAPASLGVLVVTYDNEAHLDRLLGSLRLEAASTPMRVVVVDNGSSDGTVRRARAHADVLTLTGHGNVGYAGGINVGLARLGDVPATLVLNADLVLEPGAVPALLARLPSHWTLFAAENADRVAEVAAAAPAPDPPHPEEEP